MTTVALNDFITELDTAIKAGSPARRAQMLQQIASLLLADAGRLNACQVGVFDDVLIRLIACVETPTLAPLSRALATLQSAPKQTIRHLACHEEATVAAPVLRGSDSLSESDLSEIAGTRGRQHLQAISGRKQISEPVTDVLLKRRDTSVCRLLAKNTGARFSEPGYVALVALAEREDDIADSLMLRTDLPAEMLRELLAKATKAVRGRLLKVAPPRMHEAIKAAIESLEAQIGTRPEPIDYSDAKSTVLALSKAGKLSDSTVNRFAVRGEHENLIAALSLLAEAAIEKIEPVIDDFDPGGVILACRASRLNWQTTLAVVRHRRGGRAIPADEIEQRQEAFEALSLSVAQRTIRFGSVRDLAIGTNLTGQALAMAGAR